VGTSGLGAREFGGPALVIEDDALIALELTDMLGQMGFGPVQVAHAAEEALRLMNDNAFAIAIVDIKLADGDSFDVARKLKLSGAPLVFASGYSVKLPNDLGNLPFVAKPFNDATIAEAVHAAITAPGK
jgi:DNA-binding response OmpR family regulator